VIDVGGVGFLANCTPSVAAANRVGEAATVFTSLVVREDALTLFAFQDAEERDCFELVQSVSGIGPKIALACVSVLTPQQLRQALANEDVHALTQIPGIGKKGAQRLVIELKDKAGAVPDARAAAGAQPWREQVLAGLQGLGWSLKDAEAACERVAEYAASDEKPTVAQIMRQALRSLAK
jgi:Holliday junction DNA helicase RuvA